MKYALVIAIIVTVIFTVSCTSFVKECDEITRAHALVEHYQKLIKFIGNDIELTNVLLARLGEAELLLEIAERQCDRLSRSNRLMIRLQELELKAGL